MTEKAIFGNKNTPSRRLGVMMILRYESYGFCGFSVCWHLNSVNRWLSSTTPICPLNVAWTSRQRIWNCSRTISISQEQMRRAQNYKRLIAACNPIALLAQVWHQKSIWGCLTADNRLPPNGDTEHEVSRQTTDTTLCMFRTAYLWGNLVNCHKIHKKHSD